MSSSLKYAFTERVINFQAEGIFPDDGDNLQFNNGLTLIRFLIRMEFSALQLVLR